MTEPPACYHCISWDGNLDTDNPLGRCTNPGSPHFNTLRSYLEHACPLFLTHEDVFAALKETNQPTC